MRCCEIVLYVVRHDVANSLLYYTRSSGVGRLLLAQIWTLSVWVLALNVLVQLARTVGSVGTVLATIALW